MSSRRSAHKWRLLALMVLLGAMALSSFWVLEVMRRNLNDDLPNISKDEPDFYVENFSYVKVTPNGFSDYHVAGTRLTHNPHSASYDIEQPVVHAFKPNEPAMTMHAKRGMAEEVGNRVHLYNNVELDQPASATREHFHLTSEYLLVLPDTDEMETDKPVDIKHGTTHLTGTGMYANNASGEFRLASHVNGTYFPPPRP